MHIIKRSQAIENNLKRYYTGIPCPLGHVCARMVAGRGCVECKKLSTKKWGNENREKMLDGKRKWAEKNPEKIKQYNKTSHIKNKITNKIKRNYDRSENPKKYLLYSAKSRAKKKELEFNITLTDFDIPSHCPVLNIPLMANVGGKTQKDYSPTIDRINLSKGYVVGNIIVVSAKANRIKNDATPKEIMMVASFYQNYVE